MNWKQRVNVALGEFTGFHLTKMGETPSMSATKTGKATKAAKPAAAPASDVRPPADVRTDRLLRAPIFVMSPVRSGSTLLRSILNAHSLLHAPHELHVRRLTVGFGTGLAERAMHALGHNQADLEHLLWDRVLHRELLRSGKSHIVDKTPANAFAFERLATAWPDARFVFLLRHPVSIARSWHEADPEKRDYEAAAADALRYMKAVERARKGLEGHTVHYEELTDDPEGQVRKICDFLAIPFEPAMLRYGSSQTVVQKGLGDWKDKIRSGEVQKGRDLPEESEIPDLLRPMSVSWGYLSK